MAFADFAAALQEYRSALEQAGSDASHDYRRSLFTEFLRDGFNIRARDIPLEEHIKVAEVRGFIDALYRALIFEFKRDLDRERADGKAELRRYFRAKPQAAFAFLTDGFRFEVYAPDDDDAMRHAERDGNFIRLVDSVDLRRLDEREAYRFFDSFLFADRAIAPDSQDVIVRFGSKSLTYNRAAQILREMWTRAKGDSSAQTKFAEWNRLLAKVYGSEVGNNDLFLRHTYLSLLAKTFAYLALFADAPRHHADLEGIVTGESFATQGYDNLAEEDFFAWMLHPSVQTDTVDLLRILIGRLAVYDLNQVNEDLLKELYQNLVDPATRHDLGEFYTPDWLAELTLCEAGYEGMGSVLDPACGSGTFLFTAINLARASGVKGAQLVDYAVNNIMGMDVHPLAVTIAKVNYVLALSDELRGYRSAGVRVPVYVADTIQRTRETLNGPQVVVTVTDTEPAKRSGRRRTDEFIISSRLAADRSLLETIVDEMRDAAKHSDDPNEIANGFWNAIARRGVDPVWKPDWIGNCKLLTRLIREGHDTIYGFILKNCCQPAYVAERKVDFVVGNPPWLAYNFIKHEDYQKQVRDWTFAYGLLGKDEVKLFTQMDTSTLFFVHCLEQFLKPNGVVAFVMPRSVITGAKQHEKFRGIGFNKILDCREVSNRSDKSERSLFNVPSCVLIARDGKRPIANIPCVHITGTLPARNLPWKEAQPHLKLSHDTYTPPAATGAGSPYHEHFEQGAAILPRCFYFVHSAATTKRGVINRARPALETDPAIDHDAKEPWKGKHVSGNVESEFLYATLLGDNLLPFGVRALDLVVLPVVVNNKQVEVIDRATARAKGFSGLADWLGKVEKLWNAEKKTTTEENIYEWLDYRRKISAQHPTGFYRVVYNKSGTNLACCVLDTIDKGLEAVGFKAQGFLADTVTFYFETEDEIEAHYLCAVLNSPFVNDAIKAYQTQGLWGPRDIQRRPFEVLPIPKYDAANVIHQQLAALSEACHAKVAQSAAQLQGNTGKVRSLVRSTIVAHELAQIDALVRQLFGASAAPQSQVMGKTLF